MSQKISRTMVTKKQIILKKDQDWAKAIKERDKVCQICKRSKGRLNAHHIIPRQFKETRWDLNNGILLCFQHHRVGKYSAHQNAIWFSNWLFLNNPNQHNYILRKLDQISQFPQKDYKSRKITI